MAVSREEINRLAEEFESCQKILLALGDENRHSIQKSDSSNFPGNAGKNAL